MKDQWWAGNESSTDAVGSISGEKMLHFKISFVTNPYQDFTFNFGLYVTYWGNSSHPKDSITNPRVVMNKGENSKTSQLVRLLQWRLQPKPSQFIKAFHAFLCTSTEQHFSAFQCSNNSPLRKAERGKILQQWYVSTVKADFGQENDLF